MGMYLYCQNNECGSYVDGMDCMCGWKQPLPEEPTLLPSELSTALSDAVDFLDEECQADHKGLCQTHSLQPVERCFVKVLKYYRDNNEI